MRIELLKMAKNNYWFTKTVMKQNKNIIKRCEYQYISESGEYLDCRTITESSSMRENIPEKKAQ